MQRDLNGTYERVLFEHNQSTIVYLNTESASYDTHWHTAAEIVMPLENTYTISVAGQDYELDEGDIFFIPSGELHKLTSRPSGLRIIVMFDTSLLSSIHDFASINPLFSQPLLLTDSSNAELHKACHALLLQMARENQERRILCHPMIYAYLIQFFATVGRALTDTSALFPDVRGAKQIEYFDKMNLVVNYINNNYAENITLDDIAALAGFSKFHFSRLFKQFTDQTFYSFLNQRRVKAAELLLLNPNSSITEVALLSGFSSISTFNRVFRDVKKCTPSEYKAYYQHQS